MRVLQINTVCGRGSTGIIVTEIADLLKKTGHEAYVAYGHGQSDYPNSYKIGNSLDHKIHAFIFSRVLGEQGLGSYWSTKKLIKWIDTIEPDLIHIHTLHANYIHFPLLFRFLNNRRIPVVWSFFDCWPFTGKCTHFTAVGCRKWETGCHHCDYLNLGAKTYFFDRTRKLFHLKQKWCAQLPNLDIIVCSNWLKGEVERSIYKGRPIHMIYNWIDFNKFKQIEDDSIYEKYDLDRAKKIIVSVSAEWNDSNTRLEDAIKLSTMLPSSYQLVIIGRLKTSRILPSGLRHISFVNGTEELSKLYSAATVYVNFSIEDTFGKVIAEAMLCGTPAIVFNSTACPEVVGDVGFVVEPHDYEAIIRIIEDVDAQGKGTFSERCINHVRERFDYHKNVSQYINLYEDVLKRIESNEV